MSFHSLDFILFAIVFFLIWPLMRRTPGRRWGSIVVASFVFYGWWDWRFLFLIIASGLLDYFAALAMVRFWSHRKWFLLISVIGNLGSLAVFKYLDFGVANLSWLLRLVGWEWQPRTMGIALPVGISFYTFQSMSYTIDVYRGELKPTRHLLHFFAYLAMFPQLVAGPIIRARDLLPQLLAGEGPDKDMQWDGLVLVAVGYFQKTVIADSLAPVVDHAFGANQAQVSLAYWWTIMAMFAFQIYYDFSGYSKIAGGLALWMGYRFPLNFDHPYRATSLRDFWSRWHISLSTWFRDYVYIPLGGSRKGSFRSFANMWIVMLLSGFWHGAAWTFVAWGALHALFLTMERISRWPQRIERSPLLGRTVATMFVGAQVLVTWVLFRAESLSQTMHIVLSMLDLAHVRLDFAKQMIPTKAAVFLLVSLVSEFFLSLQGPQNALRRLCDLHLAALVRPVGVAALLFAAVFFRGNSNAFIYFQF